MCCMGKRGNKMDVEKMKESIRVLRSMIEVLNTALEGQSDISDETLAWYTGQMLTLANEMAELIAQV